jgi:hypothetical protein
MRVANLVAEEQDDGRAHLLGLLLSLIPASEVKIIQPEIDQTATLRGFMLKTTTEELAALLGVELEQEQKCP